MAVFYAGTVPEAITAPVRRYKPEHVILLDAADMGTRPGTVAIVQPKEIQARLLSTHALPLSVVMEYLAKDAKTRVSLIGIQPDPSAKGPRPTSLEEAGLWRLMISFHRALLPRGAASKRSLRKSHAL